MVKVLPIRKSQSLMVESSEEVITWGSLGSINTAETVCKCPKS